MQKLLMLIISIYFNTSLFAQKPTDDFSGKWKTSEGKIITISKTQFGFIGKAEDNITIILNEIKYIDKKWSAIISNPKENKTALCELILDGKRLRIIAKKGMMSKTIIWSKIK